MGRIHVHTFLSFRAAYVQDKSFSIKIWSQKSWNSEIKKFSGYPEAINPNLRNKNNENFALIPKLLQESREKILNWQKFRTLEIKIPTLEKVGIRGIKTPKIKRNYGYPEKIHFERRDFGIFRIFSERRFLPILSTVRLWKCSFVMITRSKWVLIYQSFILPTNVKSWAQWIRKLTNNWKVSNV